MRMFGDGDLGPRRGKYDPLLPGHIWIIEGLVGPKNPNLDFTYVPASGLCDLPIVSAANGDVFIH